jgi:Protein of unknown function (DUF3592)
MKQLRQWLSPRYLLVAAVLTFLAIAAVVLPLVKLYTYPLVFLYREGSCTITSKELHVLGGGDADPTYLAHFEYTVRTPDGHSAHANRYDWFDGAGWFGSVFEQGSTNRAGEQAVLDRYAVGETYRCWYQPQAPEQAVLTQNIDWIRLIDSNLLFTVVAFVAALILLALVLIMVTIPIRFVWLAARGEPWSTGTRAEQRERARESLGRITRRVFRSDEH